MKAETIITRLQEKAEEYGCIPEMKDAIRNMYSYPSSKIPRCHICGKPFRVIDMKDEKTLFCGCPNDAHGEYDDQIRAHIQE